jgi:dihydrofolate reductase
MSLEAGIKHAESVNLINGIDEVMIIGGAAIYQASLPMADRLYLTHVHANVEGDAYFPTVDFDQWKEVGREDFKKDGSNPYDYSFSIYDRAG